jgi:hypothetical protein
MEKVSGPLAECLARCRRELNARFLAARNANPKLDAEAFLEQVGSTLDPLARAVAAVYPERVEQAILALYDVLLELVGAQLLGNSACYPVLQDAWQQLLPVMPRLVALEPQRVAAAVSNALYNLATTSGARPEFWLDQMQQVAGECPNTAAFLNCGKVLAWRAGMAHYRAGALEAATKLPAALATRALGLPQDMTPTTVQIVLERLRTDPWLSPLGAAQASLPEGRLQLLGKAGGFRGLVGPFLRPPIVWQQDGRLLTSDQEATWELFADRFGAVLMRVEVDKVPKANSNVKVGRAGELTWGGQAGRFGELVAANSSASSAKTLAVTTAASHYIYLLAIADVTTG